ncbi:cupin domain-containing protein [Parapontixanthobacter aurantiacus]|nr:cupin domain-containing protein [Parapontixanthobacter aurantiacus]
MTTTTLIAGVLLAQAAPAPASTTFETGTGEEATMEIDRKEAREPVEGPEEYFTGTAHISGQFDRAGPSRVTGAIVSFEPGARTAWHSHPLGQTLYVTQGIGWTQLRNGEKYEFYEGDILWCPPDKDHWHGATPDSSMTHYVVQEALDGENVVWKEKVTDEEYMSPLAKGGGN